MMHPLSLFISTDITIVFHNIPSRRWFRDILKSIGKMYNFISARDIKAYYYDNKRFNRCCHVSFDDGESSFYEYAFPVLKEMSIPATLFVSPMVIREGLNYWFQELSIIKSHLDETVIKTEISERFHQNYSHLKDYALLSLFKSMKIKDILSLLREIKEKYNLTVPKKYNITREQLEEIHASNIVTVGAHTLNHPILSNEDDAVAEREISGSLQELSSMLGEKIRYFAYPNGVTGLDYSLREHAILKDSAVELAFATLDGFFDEHMHPFDIARQGFGGFEKETGAWVISKLCVLPFWNIFRRIVKQEKDEMCEQKERRFLRSIQVFNQNKAYERN